MTNWRRFFQNYRIVDIKTDADLLFQVGATVGGRVISDEQFKIIIQDAVAHLRLNKNDDLMDLCCGNGVITFELAKEVNSVVGIDSSKPYIDNARRHKNRPNITYVNGDVANLKEICRQFGDKRFTKVFMRESLAYLEPGEFDLILSYLPALTTPDVVIYIAGIPDKRRKWSFFNTLSRRIYYLFTIRLLGKDFGMGRWWTRDEIAEIASRHNLSCIFVEQNPALHSAPYRFDVLMKKGM